MMAATGG